MQSLRFMLEFERLQCDGNLVVSNDSKLLVRLWAWTSDLALHAYIYGKCSNR